MKHRDTILLCLVWTIVEIGGCTHAKTTAAVAPNQKGAIIGVVHLPQNVLLNEPATLEVTVRSISGETVIHFEEFRDNREWPIEFEIHPNCFDSESLRCKFVHNEVNVTVRVIPPGQQGYISNSQVYTRQDSEQGRKMNIPLLPA